MAVVNKFNVNREQVTFDADIIENMSANDVSYDDSTQYDENTVGNKLSELEAKINVTPKLADNSRSLSDFDISDEDGNVIVRFNGGDIQTKNFDSRNVSSGEVIVEYSDTDSINAFIQAMQAKANKIGMDITIDSLSGASYNQKSDAKSMAKLYLVASGYDELSKIWNQATDITIYSKGSIKTSHILHSSVFSYNDGEHYANDLIDYYPLLGGKTGSWIDRTLLGGIIPGPNGELLSCWLRRTNRDSASSNRFKAMKILVDIAYSKLNNPSADITTLQNDLIAQSTQSAQVYKVPISGNVMSWETYQFSDSAYDIYNYNHTTKDYVASNIKILNAITVLDYVSDLNELVTIKQSDLVGGSSSTPEFIAGEKFTIREILLAMMMPSSNSGATALGRHIGNKLLNNRYNGLK